MPGATPRIRDHMSPLAHQVTGETTLAEAKEMLAEAGIRHLPVMEGDLLVGMVSLSDIFAVETLLGVDPDEVSVSTGMSRELYTVEPDTPLQTVAAEMTTRRIGSAVVVENGVPVGVFTGTDACRVLAEILAQTRGSAEG